jgi:hypothetical protein
LSAPYVEYLTWENGMPRHIFEHFFEGLRYVTGEDVKKNLDNNNNNNNKEKTKRSFGQYQENEPKLKGK